MLNTVMVGGQNEKNWKERIVCRVKEIQADKYPSSDKKLSEVLIEFIENVSINENVQKLLASSFKIKKYQNINERLPNLTRSELKEKIGEDYKQLNYSKNVPDTIDDKGSIDELYNVISFISHMIKKEESKAFQITSADAADNSFLKQLQSNRKSDREIYKIEYSELSDKDFLLLFEKSFYKFSELKEIVLEYLLKKIYWYYFPESINELKVENNIIHDVSAINLQFLQHNKECEERKLTQSELKDEELELIRNLVKNIRKAEINVSGKDIFYRGHTNMNYMLTPSLYRKRSFIKNEANLCDESIRRVPDEFQNKNSKLDQLVHMQHYELPTRILDITAAYKVGLFFSCYDPEKNNTDQYGELILLNQEKDFYSRSDTGSLLAALSGLDYEEKKKLYELATFFAKIQKRMDNLKNKNSIEVWNLKRILQSMSLKEYSDAKNKFNEDAEINREIILLPNVQKKRTLDLSGNLKEEHFVAKKRLLHQVRLEKPSFTDDIIYSDLLSHIFIKPDMKNHRIERQRGAFILTGLCKDMNSALIAESIEEYRLKRKDNNTKKTTVFLIEPKMKKPLMEWLNSEKILESYLFPEMPYVMKAVREKFDK